MELDGKRIILTGGSGGMGSEVIGVLTAAGATVTAVDKTDAPGRRAASDAGGPGSATFKQLDLTDVDATRRVFDEAITEMGGLDALIHTAGVHRAAPVEEIDDDLWDFVFDINVRGTRNANQAVFEALKANGGGSIVNFGSNSGVTPRPTSATYSASKGAVHSWTRSVAYAWAEYGIRVNAVLPMIATPMYLAAKAAMTDAEREQYERETEGGIPLGHAFGDARRDLGPVLVFLAGDGSRFITGQLIPVDGGLVTTR